MLRITFWRSGSCLSSWLPLSVFIFVFFFVVLLKCWPGELHGRPVLVSCPLFSPRYIDSLLLSIKTLKKQKNKRENNSRTKWARKRDGQHSNSLRKGIRINKRAFYKNKYFPGIDGAATASRRLLIGKPPNRFPCILPRTGSRFLTAIVC